MISYFGRTLEKHEKFQILWFRRRQIFFVKLLENLLLCLLELHGILPRLFEAHITGELHQELETLNVVRELPVNCLVRLQGLVVVTRSPTTQDR